MTKKITLKSKKTWQNVVCTFHPANTEIGYILEICNNENVSADIVKEKATKLILNLTGADNDVKNVISKIKEKYNNNFKIA